MAQEEWEVERILQRGRVDDVTHYLIKWKGYTIEESTWEPITNLQNCEDAIIQFESIFSKKATKSKKKQAKQKQFNYGKIFSQEQRSFKNQGKSQEKDPSFIFPETDSQPCKDSQQIRRLRNRAKKQALSIFQKRRNYLQSSASEEEIQINKGGESNQPDKLKLKGGILSQIGKLSQYQKIGKKIKCNPRVEMEDLPESQKEREETTQKNMILVCEKSLNLQKQMKFGCQLVREGQAHLEQIAEMRNNDYQSNVIKTARDCVLDVIKNKQAQIKLLNEPQTLIQQQKQIIQSHEDNTSKIPQRKQQTNEQNIQPVKKQALLLQSIQTSPNPQKILENMIYPLRSLCQSETTRTLIKGSQRYLRCDQEMLNQKKTILRNIMRKELGLELGKYKLRAIDISMDPSLNLELGDLKKVESQAGIQKIEMIIKVAYGWIAQCRSYDQGLFLIDVNFIREETWKSIISRYFTP